MAKYGMQCVLACDIDPVARKTYAENYQIEPMGDIYSIDIGSLPEFDVICAGFPCQPFSNAGQHRGFEDARGTIFFEIMRWVDAQKPKYIVFENVPALVSHNGGDTFAHICNHMRSAGYSIAHTIVKCSDYGIPQMRKRVLLVGIKGDTDARQLLNFDRFKKNVLLRDYMEKPFEKDTAYTIRCGGRGSKLGNKHNWDAYIVGGEEYRLTVEDGLHLQGFPKDFKLHGSVSQQWHQLGNTIPTNFTDMIAQNIIQAEGLSLPQSNHQTEA
jgi:DNA (cytosine-5)-methyltransferase 1